MQTSESFSFKRMSNGQRFFTLLKYAVLIFLVMMIIGPIIMVVLAGMRTNGEFQSRPFDIPRGEIQWGNFTGILESDTFWVAARNSFYITAAVTIINLSLASMLAFAFSRLTFFGKGIIFNILSFGLLFPTVVAILPIFLQIRDLGLINNLWGVIFPMVAFGLPGSVIILRSFFIAIPNELEDASYIDGCSTFGFFRFILMPISRPALMAVATLNVVGAWNEYFLPLLILNDPNKWPLPLGIMQFQGQYGTDWARVMAYVGILMVPAIIFYLFTERFIVTGLTGGELKG
ncbi:MAG: carbohydrate ABC transporter permease [Anaerolineae bacterium]|nr:carbohydrate ABC transporter permease [Anaerolineae bacterium]